MIRKFRFFSESSIAQEVIEIEGLDDDEIQEKLDAAWGEHERAETWDGVDDYHGPLE